MNCSTGLGTLQVSRLASAVWGLWLGLWDGSRLRVQDMHNHATDNTVWPDDVRVIPHIFEEHDLLVVRSRLLSYTGGSVSGLLCFLLDVTQRLLLLLLLILPLLPLRLQGLRQQQQQEQK